MTEDQLKAIEARAAKASPAPWRSMGIGIICAPDTRQEAYVLQVDKNGWPEPLDAYFIAAARSDVPELIAEVRRLREVISKLPHAHSCDLTAAASDRPDWDAADRHENAVCTCGRDAASVSR